jgi:hypothetical protein
LSRCGQISDFGFGKKQAQRHTEEWIKEKIYNYSLYMGTILTGRYLVSLNKEGYKRIIW